MIDVSHLTVQLGQRVLLQDASLFVADGQKVGIIGHNGCGKSTFLNVLLGFLEPTSGEIRLPNPCRLAYAEQTITDIHRSATDYVLSKNTELCYWRAQSENAADIDLPEVMDQLKRLDSEGAEGRIAHILKGLGFSETDRLKPVSDFSGGWRMRLSLAGALFQQSDILLLDEPTNHLDLEASIWLTDYLKKYKGTLLIISHDRRILNEICTHTVYLENQQFTLYRGAFDTALETRQNVRKQLAAEAAKTQAKRAHMQAYVDRFRYKASKAKQAQSRLKMLEKLSDVPQLSVEAVDSFAFLKPEKLSPPLVRVDDVSVGYGENVVLRHLSFSIGVNERIALLGRNGNGKSTLAKLICGRLTPQTGGIHRLSGLKIGYFSQHQEEDLPTDETPVDFFTPLMPDQKPAQVRGYLARFGIDGDKALTAIGKLSGGEKARLVFAKMALEKPALLILDEPTNHLDMKGREALLEALNAFEGSVILITHDFHLVELFADDLWLIDKGRCQTFAGDLADYQSYLLRQEPEKKLAVKPEPAQPKAGNVARASMSEIRRAKAKMGEAERTLEALETEKSALQKQFETPLSGEQIRALQARLQEIETQIESAEKMWLELSEVLL